ncbi:hypothetical protein HK096_001142 [Nowakowskiella sp. JEL0078]|nr:hypothetical protein HK096_001142 [Nowakowskiella sp. JEL0078]
MNRDLVDEKESNIPSAESSASIFDIVTFRWFSSLVGISRSRTIIAKDVWQLSDQDKTANIIPRFEIAKEKYKSLIFRVFYLERYKLLMQISFAAISSVLSFSGPFFLNRIVNFIQNSDNTDTNLGLIYVFALLMTGLLRSICDGQAEINARRVGTRVRAALISEIYKKALTCVLNIAPKESRGDEVDEDGDSPEDEPTVGKITTIMSVDAERIREFNTFLPLLLFSPIQCLLCTSALIYVLGWRAALGGVAMMAGLIPLTMFLGKVTSKIQSKVMAATDKRVGLINEVLQGISIVKSFAWEPKFIEEINKLRRKELRQLIKLNWIGAFGHMSWHGIPIVVSLVTFFIFAKVDPNHPDLTAASAFTAIALFTLLRIPLTSFPFVLVKLWEVGVSFNRVETFLSRGNVEKLRRPPSSKNGVLGFVNGWYMWAKEEELEESGSSDLTKVTERTPLLQKENTQTSLISGSTFVLKDLNIEFVKGGVTAVVGSTGSGKSSLLNALLGEMTQISGSTFLPRGEVSYAAQTAFICNATIRENILFGEEFDPVRYSQVIACCALEKDLEVLAGGPSSEGFIGDLVEIGEKGIGLSGGQKQRISLARAAYSKAQYVLLDDCLSAVDPPTAKHLFEQCILGFMAGRTRVLITHAVDLVSPQVDLIVSVKDRSASIETRNKVGMSSRFSASSSSLSSMGTLEEDVESKPKHGKETDANRTSALKRGKLVQEEETMSGSISGKVYLHYLNAGAGGGRDDTVVDAWERILMPIRMGFYLIILISVLFIFRSIGITNDYWLRIWAKAYDTESGFSVKNISSSLLAVTDFKDINSEIGTSTASTSVINGLFASTMQFEKYMLFGSKIDVDHYLRIYACLGGVLLLSTLGPYTTRVVGSYNASKRLHAQLLHRIMNAPLRFFSITPLGRIIVS